MSYNFHTSDGIEYQQDKYGVLHQVDPQPFKYDAKYSGCYDRPEYVAAADKLQAMRYAFAVAAHGRPITSLMDVGYGNGSFIRICLNQVPIVYGMDVTGIKVPYGAQQVTEYMKCDVITYHDVIEHLHDQSFIPNLPCETLILSVPYCHYHVFGRDWFDTWFHRKPDEHIHFYSERSLQLFLAANGWEACAVSVHEDLVRIPRQEGVSNILTMAFKRPVRNGGPAY